MLTEKNISDLQIVSSWWYQVYRLYLWVSRKDDYALMSLQRSIGYYPPYIFKNLYKLHLYESAFNKANSEPDSCNGKDVDKKHKAFHKDEKYFINEAIRYSVAKLRYSDKYYSPLAVFAYFFHSFEKKQLLDEIKDKCLDSKSGISKDFYTNSLVCRYASYKVIERADLKKDGIEYNFDSPDVFLLKEQIKYAGDINNNFRFSVKVAKSESVFIKDSIKNNYISLLQAKTKKAQINSRKSYKTLSFLKCLWYKVSFILNSMKLWYYGSSLKNFSISDDALQNHINDLHSKKNGLYQKLKLLNSYSYIFNTTERKKRFVSDVKDIIANNKNYTDLSKVKNKVLSYASSQGYLDQLTKWLSDYGIDIDDNAVSDVESEQGFNEDYFDSESNRSSRSDTSYDSAARSAASSESGDESTSESEVEIAASQSATRDGFEVIDGEVAESSQVLNDPISDSGVFRNAVANQSPPIDRFNISDDMAASSAQAVSRSTSASGLRPEVEIVANQSAASDRPGVSDGGVAVSTQSDNESVSAPEVEIVANQSAASDRSGVSDGGVAESSQVLNDPISDSGVFRNAVANQLPPIDRFDISDDMAASGAQAVSRSASASGLRPEVEIVANQSAASDRPGVSDGGVAVSTQSDNESVSAPEVEIAASQSATRDGFEVIDGEFAESSQVLNDPISDFGVFRNAVANQLPPIDRFDISDDMAASGAQDISRSTSASGLRPEVEIVANQSAASDRPGVSDGGVAVSTQFDNESVSAPEVKPAPKVEVAASQSATRDGFEVIDGEVAESSQVLNDPISDSGVFRNAVANQSPPIDRFDISDDMAASSAQDISRSTSASGLRPEVDTESYRPSRSNASDDGGGSVASPTAYSFSDVFYNIDGDLVVTAIDVGYISDSNDIPILTAYPVGDCESDQPSGSDRHTNNDGVSAASAEYVDEPTSKSGLDSEDGTSLIQACIEGDIRLVFSLYNKGVYVNQEDTEGRTALIHACIKGNVELVDLLLDMGVDINHEDTESRTALTYALSEKHIEIVKKLLLNSFINLKYIDKSGKSYLMYSLSCGNQDVIEYLCVRTNINHQDEEGRTALMQAYIKGDMTLCCLLYDKGANIDYNDNLGRTALIHACINGDIKLVDLLLERGAYINHKDGKGKTSLIYALKEKHIEIVKKLLLNSFIDLKYTDKYGKSYLMYSLSCGNQDVIENLCIRTDINHQDDLGRTVLMQACSKKDISLVHFLLTKGANINHQDKAGKTSLILAAAVGDKELASCLIGGGADINIKDISGSTALIWAACGEHYEFVMELLSYQSTDVRICNNIGKNALSYVKEKIRVMKKIKGDIDILLNDDDRTQKLLNSADERTEMLINIAIQLKSKQAQNRAGFFGETRPATRDNRAAEQDSTPNMAQNNLSK